MLRFKKLSAGKYCILDGSNVTLFDKSGKCLDDKLTVTPEYLNGSVIANYVSIVSSGKRLEVAFFINDVMTKYLSSLEPQDCVMKAYSLIKPLCFLRRNGKTDNINYNQVIFVCPDTYTGSTLISDLQLTKID